MGLEECCRYFYTEYEFWVPTKTRWVFGKKRALYWGRVKLPPKPKSRSCFCNPACETNLLSWIISRYVTDACSYPIVSLFAILPLLPRYYHHKILIFWEFHIQDFTIFWSKRTVCTPDPQFNKICIISKVI